MKKSFALVGLAAMMLAACGGNNAASGTTESATVATDTGEVTATLTKDAEGKLTGVNIYEIKDGESKKDLGDEYEMKKASDIGKEWYEQIEFLENYIIENGVDSVKLNADGYAESEDVKAGCTINLKTIMEAVDEANAK